MTDPILKQQQIAAYLGNLLNRVRRLEKSLRNTANSDLNSNSEAAQDGNPFLNPYVFIPCEVTSVVDASTVIGKEVFPTASEATPWAIANENAQAEISITVPSNGTVPSVGDTVLAHFTGTHGTGDDITPRYGLFGGGGSQVLQMRVKDLGGDYLECLRIEGGTEVGAIQYVARSETMRQSLWDNQTVDGITYTYSDSESRTAVDSLTGGEEVQDITPSFIEDRSIVVVGSLPEEIELDLGPSGTITTRLVDLNNDARQFAAEIQT